MNIKSNQYIICLQGRSFINMLAFRRWYCTVYYYNRISDWFLSYWYAMAFIFQS